MSRVGMAAVVLHTLRPEWGMSSFCPSCTAVEAYIRLAGIEFGVERSDSWSQSPTAILPALEDGEYVVVEEDQENANEISASKEAIMYLQRMRKNLDASLSSHDKADLLAFRALVEGHLLPATLYATWADKNGYSKYTRKAWAHQLPAPVSYIVPGMMRRAVLRRRTVTGMTEEEMLSLATKAYEALAARLSDGRQFMMGDNPTSVDALVFAHLQYHITAPVAEELLRPAATRYPQLTQYVDRIAGKYFQTPAISADLLEKAAQSRRDHSRKQKREETESEARHRRRSWMWIGCSFLIMVGYATGSEYIFQLMGSDVEIVEEEEDS